jgi:mannose-6-phosphate isomerase-like protein (cupin superfamily)
MSDFMTKRLPVAPHATAPDGSDVRILLGLDGGNMAHFELAPGQTSVAVAHHTVEEIWYFLSGRGEMWRKLGDQEEVVPVDPGVCITILVGTHFQFCSFGYEPLAALGVAMPPWPGEGEAYKVEGKWTPTVEAGSG